MSPLKLATALLVVVFSGCAAEDMSGGDPEVEAAEEAESSEQEETAAGPDECESQKRPSLTVMSYNVKRGQQSGNVALADSVLEHRPDLVGMQEIGNGTTDNGGTNQLYYLAQKTGLGPALRNAKAVDGGNQANGLLSRFPIRNNEKFILTATDEMRILVVLTVQITDDFTATVGVVHFGLNADERLVQAQEVVDILRERPNPILLGDFNAQPDEPTIGVINDLFTDAWDLAGDGDGFTFPADVPDRRIDYVFVGPGWPAPVDAHVAESIASDHRPLVVEFPMPGDDGL